MFFDDVPEGPPDPIFGMLGTFEADKRSNKVSLMVGIFKDENLHSELLPVVRQAKEEILSSDQLADYLPMDGIAELGQRVGALLFGEKNWERHRERIYSAQSVGGTGALRIGADFLRERVGKKAYLPHPTWPNHRSIFEKAGFEVQSLPYYNREIHQFDRGAFLQSLREREPLSVVLFHAACHNPTGSDPPLQDWKEIAAICKEKSLFPFFDCAYQGFGEGVEEDAKAIRLFLEEGLELLVAYSCSKNFSLYCQRVGILFAVCPNEAVKRRVGSQIKRVIRPMYSNPPAHGARIVLKILQDPDLSAAWQMEVEQMRQRISTARKSLIQKLFVQSKGSDFSFLQHHKGMFSYLDLDQAQVQELIDKYGVYTLESGRINVAGLTPRNIDQVVDRILAVSER
ncbi:MAG TPA: aromatic amino acid transaminase [Chlamydiales bacterium]|jgi:aspartate aminotransferase|nr:aromatic amino acid transaminase [Chlamydiales bacterium]